MGPLSNNFSKYFVLLMVLVFTSPVMAAKFKVFGKKEKPQPVVEEDVTDDEDYVDRENMDLSQLASKEVIIDGAVCDACVFKIRSVLQESDEVFKVNHEDYKVYYIYFNKGKTLSDDKIKELVKLSGYTVKEVKPQVVARKPSPSSAAK